VAEVEIVRVRFDDGAVIELSRRAAADIYDLLWMLSTEPGAVSAAGKLQHALRRSLVEEPVALDLAESNVFAKAHARLG
jgi:hypothetical protein